MSAGPNPRWPKLTAVNLGVRAFRAALRSNEALYRRGLPPAAPLARDGVRPSAEKQSSPLPR
jgi:hypothetical protein